MTPEARNKLIALIVGIVLSVSGALLGYNMKDAVCGPSEPTPAASK